VNRHSSVFLSNKSDVTSAQKGESSINSHDKYHTEYLLSKQTDTRTHTQTQDGGCAVNKMWARLSWNVKGG